MDSNKFQLYVYENDFGLPSMDTESCKCILYTKLAQVPVTINYMNSIKKCLVYSAPSLVSGDLVLSSFPEMVKHLRSQNYNLETNLNNKELSETHALTTLCDWKLKPALEFFTWMDPRNSEELSGKWYMKALPVPFNYMKVKKCKSEACGLIETLYPQDSHIDVIKEYIVKSTTEVLSTLSARLGQADWFFAPGATILDIVLYSYIAPMIKVKFPNSELRNLVQMWPNLVSFVKRFDAKYLPNIQSDSKYVQLIDTVKQNDEEVSYAAIFILVASATSIMLGFALSRGVFAQG